MSIPLNTPYHQKLGILTRQSDPGATAGIDTTELPIPVTTVLSACVF